MNPDQQQTRREFFRSLGRGAVLGALAVGGAVLALGKRPARRRETCIGGGICRGCPALRDCGLPAALSFKRAGG